MDENDKRQYPLVEFVSALEWTVSPLQSKYEEIAEKEWMKWWFEYSLLPKHFFEKRIKEAVILFAGHQLSLCTDITRYEQILKYYGFLFVWDDHNETNFGDVGRDISQTIRLKDQMFEAIDKLEDKSIFVDTTKWKPYVMALYAILEVICNEYNSVQKRRLLTEIRNYVESQVEESVAIVNCEKQSLDSLFKVENSTSNILLYIRPESLNNMINFNILYIHYI